MPKTAPSSQLLKYPHCTHRGDKCSKARHLTCAMRCWNRLSPVLPPPAEGVGAARHAHTPGDRAEPSSRSNGEISLLHSLTSSCFSYWTKAHGIPKRTDTRTDTEWHNLLFVGNTDVSTGLPRKFRVAGHSPSERPTPKGWSRANERGHSEGLWPTFMLAAPTVRSDSCRHHDTGIGSWTRP